jgi:hypothetical protein
MNDLDRRYQARLESLGKTEAEIAAEKANSLGRTARKLEGLLAELQELAAAFAAATAAPDVTDAARDELRRRHAEVRKQAETQRWYLLVQREALGLRQHALIDRYYPLPPPLR